MTREVLISLVHLHVVSVAQQDAGEEVATSDSPRSVDTYDDESDTLSLAGIQPLLSLLVKVLVDSRTRTVHRRNVASVLIRLLNGTTTNESSLVCRNLSLVLQQTIAVEVHQVMKVDVKAQRRKRKRTKTTSDNNENTSCHCRPLGSFAADDVQVIAQVLKQVSVYTLPSLDSVLSGLARDIVANNKDSSSSSRPKNGNYRIGKYSRNAVSLQLALASGIMAKSSTLESFKNKTGMQVGDFLSSIITWLAGQRRGGEAMRIRTLQAVAIVACLDFVATSVPHVATMPLDQLRILVDLIQDYSRVSSQVLQLDSPPRSADERQSAVSILFSVAALLAGTTRVIPTSCPADILQVNCVQKRTCLCILDVNLTKILLAFPSPTSGNCIHVPNAVSDKRLANRGTYRNVARPVCFHHSFCSSRYSTRMYTDWRSRIATVPIARTRVPQS